MNTKISVDRVFISFFDEIQLLGFYVEDQQGDTLFYGDRIQLNINFIKIRQRRLEFDRIELDRPHFYLKQFSDSVGGTNLDFIVNYFTPAEKDTSARRQISVYSDDMRINDARFKLRKPGSPEKSFGVDFNNLDISSINIDLEKVELENDTLYADAQYIAFKDRSGFEVERLGALFKLSSSTMDFDDLTLRTPNSTVRTDLFFNYDHFRSFRNFVDSVYIRSDFQTSDINFSDISYFATDLQGFDQRLNIDGRVRGTVADLRGSGLKVAFGDHSYFIGDCDLTGLPDVESTFISLNLKKFSTTAGDLEHIQLPPFDEEHYVDLPSEFDALGTIVFSGQFTGFYNDFVAYGEMRSDIGRLVLDLGITQEEAGEATEYSGELKSDAFDFGAFFDIADLGVVSSNLTISGRGLTLEELNTEVEGEVTQIIFRNYSYEEIELSANLEKNLFNGQMKLNDANLSVDFDGLVDLRADTAVFDFVSNLYHANLGALNLLELEEYSSLTSRIEVKADALSLENFRGEVVARSTSLCLGDDEEEEFHMGDIVITSQREVSGRRMMLSSDILDASINGDFQTADIPNGFLSVIQSIAPALFDSGPEMWQVKNQKFEYSLNLKDYTLIQTLFTPGIDVGRTELSGNYDARNTTFNIDVETDYLRFGNLSINGISVDADKSNGTLGIQISADSLPLADSLLFQNIGFSGVAGEDIVEGKLVFDDHRGRLSNIPLQAEVLGRSKFDVTINPAEIYLLGESWKNDSASFVGIDSSAVKFHNFSFYSGERSLMIEGGISEAMEDQLDFEIFNFDIQLVNALTKENVPGFYGFLNASGHIESAEEGNAIDTEIDLRQFRIEDHDLGHLHADANWDFRRKILDLSGSLKYRDRESIAIGGTYNPGLDTSPLNAEATFDRFDLSILDVLIPSGVSEFEGKLNGTVGITGSFSEPLFDGTLDMANAGVKIDYLNTKYFLNDEVVIAPDYIGFDYIPVRDEEGNTGHLVGTVFHENFRDLTYNFYVEMQQMLALNTTLYDNDLFYGKAYATGSVGVTGYDSNVQIEVTAASAPGTYIYLPLGGPTEVSLEQFVTFVSASEGDQVQEQLDLSGITLLMDLQVTPDMQVELVFDESLGDIMRARGAGAINMEITPDGQFSMFGRYEIESGEYLFTLQNIINKKFSIEKGGVIGWYGDPYDADIDLQAVYKSRASLADLMGEFAEGYTSRVPVHLVLQLTNKLLNPTVDFSVRLPSADESMQNLVNSVLSSEEEKNKQAFSLLVLNRFLPPSNRAATTSAQMNIGAATTTDMLSSQLSNWLSQISDDFNVGVNYRPGDNITNEELAVALSTQLLNDRLLLSGSFGVSNTPANISAETNNQVIGDFMAEYLITEDGKLRLKVFSESADYNILQTYRTGTIQGAGVSFQEDFDSFSELACRLRNLLRGKDEKVSCEDLY